MGKKSRLRKKRARREMDLRSRTWRKRHPETDPAVTAAYLDDPIAMLQDGDYAALDAYEPARDGLEPPAVEAAERPLPDVDALDA